MAYRTTLTPILGRGADVPEDETTVEFMNMKFGELLGNTEDNRQQISISSGKITALETDRGYLTTKVYSGIDFNTLVTNGKYRVGLGTNKPDNSTDSTFLIEVTSMSATYVYQKAICIYSNLGNTGKKYERTSSNGVFGAWQETATTDKIDILSASVLNGWSIIEAPASVSLNGKSVTLDIVLYNGVKTVNTILFNLLAQFRPVVNRTIYIDCMDNNGTWLGKCAIVISTNGDVKIATAPPTNTTILNFHKNYNI